MDPELIGTVPRRHIGLIGMMGSGKTTIGRRVARELDRSFVDSDALVVEHTGLTIPEMFETHGEPWFRQQETAALEAALSSDEPIVLAVAGGAVLAPANRQLLRDRCLIVWLRATPETIISRIGDGKGRPLLADDPEGAIRRYDAVRRPVYTEVAHMVVDVDGVTVSRATTRVLRALAGS